MHGTEQLVKNECFWSSRDKKIISKVGTANVSAELTTCYANSNSNSNIYFSSNSNLQR